MYFILKNSKKNYYFSEKKNFEQIFVDEQIKAFAFSVEMLVYWKNFFSRLKLKTNVGKMARHVRCRLSPLLAPEVYRLAYHYGH